jgi:cytochrome c oxidase cbb3-type subunit 1
MFAQLTLHERQQAILLALAVVICGVLLALVGRDDPLGVHGVLSALAGILVIFRLGAVYYEPEPSEERFKSYYDDPSRFGIVAAMVWVVFGLAIGDWVAWQLVNSDLTFGGGWSSFGRLRPVHTT